MKTSEKNVKLLVKKFALASMEWKTKDFPPLTNSYMGFEFSLLENQVTQ